MELHDCFSITELVTYETCTFRSAAGPCGRPGRLLRPPGRRRAGPGGRGLKVLRPPHRGLRTAHALRMYLQLHGRAGERQSRSRFLA